MITTDKTHIAHLVEICVQRGVKTVVISPGSRNAPLIIAFDEHPEIKIYLIHDERCAAFFALGLAESINQPVALNCTSGSALLNYAPAIAEAYYRQIPLLILTADRPVSLIDQGDGQTIRQKNIFQNYIKAQFELPDFLIENNLQKSDQVINLAINELQTMPIGPVHLNIPLNEPLYGLSELVSKPEIIFHEAAKKILSLSEKDEIQKWWIASEKKLVIIGQQPKHIQLQNLIQQLSNDPSVAILVENTSNVQQFEKIVHCIDRTLAAIGEKEINEFIPDLIISIGGAVISKKIKALFRKHKPTVNWRVGEYLFEEDTYQSLSKSFDVSALHFFEFILDISYTPHNNFGNKWKQKDFLAQEKHNKFLATTDFSDLKVFDIVLDALPDNCKLHLGNSSVVRYAQLFNPIPTVTYYSNRGVSGIDGSTSTAAGVAVASPNQLNVLICGDISFLYDSNALWNDYLSINFKIIVINNGGGGIFQILEGSNSVKQAPLFFAKQHVDVSKICAAFGVHYTEANDEHELLFQLPQFFASSDDNRPSLMEVKTFSCSNAKVLKDYFESIA